MPFAWMVALYSLLAVSGAAGSGLLVSPDTASQFQRLLNGDSRLGLVIGFHDRYQAIQLGQFGRLLAADQGAPGLQVLQSRTGQPDFFSPAGAASGFQYQVEGDLFELLGKWQPDLGGVSESGAAFFVERLSPSLFLFNRPRFSRCGYIGTGTSAHLVEVARNQFIIRPFPLKLADQVAVILARPANQIDWACLREIVYSFGDHFAQFSFQINRAQVAPHFRGFISKEPLDRLLQPRVANYHSEVVPQQTRAALSDFPGLAVRTSLAQSAVNEVYP